MPTPVIVARDNRVIDINGAAGEFIGRSERSIVGNSIDQSIVAEPASALDPTKHRTAASVDVEVRAAHRSSPGPTWKGRVRFMEPGRASSCW